ncbi:hypothetical protein WICMUC_001997 [Wickerhamomyces mucosus]|uniref:Peroxidase n=1 Tax=Wickerhamomyces mucosus TaxID=1378264 RepID=A0A9P8TEX7_9ASCO|nr:hypothetical protein WICMUC_001997 [Wickerhamomyces mucosus]
MSSIAFNIAKSNFSKRSLYTLAGLTTLAGVISYNNSNTNNKNNNGGPNKFSNSSKVLASAATLNVALNDDKHDLKDYQQVYNDIAQKIREYDEYDEAIGFGPALVRLAWHLSGTFVGPKGCPHFSGGSYGGTIRLPKEAKDPANNALENARWLLDPIKSKYSWISYGDLYTLSGVTAIQELGGPKIKWRPGRKDLGEEYASNSVLPDASRDADYVRGLFVRRMGFTDQETVALIGAHALGSCHIQAPILPGAKESTGPGSGYTGRWTASPNFFTNEFFRLLLEDKWTQKKWSGPVQYQNSDDSLMMLPADLALVEDPAFKKFVQEYAKDQDKYFKDFAAAFQKLLELGIDFKGKREFEFKTLDEQDI